MKISKPVTICNSCGMESLDSSQFAVVTLTIDGHVEYLTDICRELCLPKLVELGRRSITEVQTEEQVHETGTVCIHCGRTFQSPSGLKVHVARKHA